MTKNPGPTARDIEVAGTLRTGIHRLVKLVRRETRNEANLSLTERSTMGSLYPDRSLEPTHIARAEKVTTQSMSQVINNLYKKGFIDKTPSAEDKRKVLLSLTPAGRLYIEQLRQDKQEWLAKSLHERTTTDEKDLLMKALQVLAKLTEE
jgi:DNA-binding MarR family transcriptional regulator